MTDTTATKKTLNKTYAAWRDAALADGWHIKLGAPWGSHEGDFTTVLVKDDMQVWLVDRVINGRTERRTCGWFNDGFASMSKVPEVYDAQELEDMREKSLLIDCAPC